MTPNTGFFFYTKTENAWKGNIVSAGRWWGWGQNTGRTQGPNSYGDPIWDIPNIAPPLLGTDMDVTQISVGNDHMCALYIDGSVRCSGANNNGVLGTLFSFLLLPQACTIRTSN